MARQLLILRHAKSAWDTSAESDFERPLAKRGLRDVPNMGAWLKEQKLTPDYVVSSPAERAKQTVVGVCRVLDIKKKHIHWDQRIYGADTEELLEVLSEVPETAKTVLIVGHNPGLEFLFSYLVSNTNGGGRDTAAIHGFGAIKTATLVRLEMPDTWDSIKQKSATLVKIKYPRELSSQSK